MGRKNGLWHCTRAQSDHAKNCGNAKEWNPRKLLDPCSRTLATPMAVTICIIILLELTPTYRASYVGCALAIKVRLQVRFDFCISSIIFTSTPKCKKPNSVLYWHQYTLLWQNAALTKKILHHLHKWDTNLSAETTLTANIRIFHNQGKRAYFVLTDWIITKEKLFTATNFQNICHKMLLNALLSLFWFQI